MKRFLTAVVLSLTIAAPNAFAGDTRVELPLQDLIDSPQAKEAGIDVLTGGTDVHLVLVDLRNSAIHGQQAEDILHEAGITVNRNAVPFDPRPPMTPSGVRIGTAALATRGFGDEEFTEVADIIAIALKPNPDVAALRARVQKLTDGYPLYEGLTSPGQWA